MKETSWGRPLAIALRSAPLNAFPYKLCEKHATISQASPAKQPSPIHELHFTLFPPPCTLHTRTLRHATPRTRTRYTFSLAIKKNFSFLLAFFPVRSYILHTRSIPQRFNNLKSSMKTPAHIQVTFVSYLAPTDTLGARIKLEDGTSGKVRTIPYNHAFNSPEQGALAWFAEHNVHPVGRASYGRNIEQAVLIHAPEDSSALFALFVRP